MKKILFVIAIAVLTVIWLGTVSYAKTNADQQKTEDKTASAAGTGENIGKSADELGKEVSKSANTMGENAVRGSGDILNSVGQFLQELGVNMKKSEGPESKTTAPAAEIKDKEDIKDTTGGYKNVPQKKTTYSCPSCGQKFEVSGIPGGSNVFCPACGKTIEK